MCGDRHFATVDQVLQIPDLDNTVGPTAVQLIPPCLYARDSTLVAPETVKPTSTHTTIPNEPVFP